MKVVINGEMKEVAKEINLRTLIKNLSLASEKIAVELNKQVVRKKDWEKIEIKEADKVEIIHFVGGG